MSKADGTVAATAASRKNLDAEIEDLHGRLHDEIARWYAVCVAASTIAGLVTFQARGVELVRSLLSSAMGPATAALDVSGQLQTALKTRAAQLQPQGGRHE